MYYIFKKLFSQIGCSLRERENKKPVLHLAKNFALFCVFLLLAGLILNACVRLVHAAGGHVATNVTITGTPKVGQTLTGTYTYINDPWTSVGNVGFSYNEADYTSLAFNSSGTPYIAYNWKKDKKRV